MFTQLGLRNVRVDKVGNVLGSTRQPRTRTSSSRRTSTRCFQGTDVSEREGTC